VSFIESRRLRLVPATPASIRADLAGRAALAAALGCRVPDNWPPELYDRPALEFYLAQLRDRAEHGWSTWYLLSHDDPPELMGVCGFKGRPDAHGLVEIGYSILGQFRNQGLASEAVSRLVEWAFAHPVVSEVSAETLPHLVQSIRVLERNGFRLAGAGSEHGVVRYSLPRFALD